MSAAKISSLSVFFPCLNEEQNLPRILKKCEEILPTLAKEYEIIIVDDGSTDKTGELADKAVQENEHIRVVHHPMNLGYGASLRSGFREAKMEWVFFTDGDQQFDLQELEKFIPYTKSHEVIIGYRQNRAEGQLRAFNARLFKLYVDLLFRLHVKDIDCAFKLIKTSLIQSLQLDSSGAFISAEFLYRLKKKGKKFVQIPVVHYPRKFGAPTGNNPKVVIKAGLEALKLYAHMKFHLTL